MNRAQWAKLSPEEQRIKFAELRGFKKNPNSWDREGMYHTYWNLSDDEADPDREYHVWQLPDIDDLNVIHEAETVLDAVQSMDYNAWLLAIGSSFAYPWKATAAQRVEAFALTMEKT